MGSTADKAKGVANKAIGKVKQGAGEATDDESLKGEGKSTIAAALADSAARGGQRTLLIDADAKAQALTRRLAPRSKRGLFDVLRGDVALDDALITHSSSTKLLPVGKVDSDATASLTKSGLASLWDKTSPAYDMVLIAVRFKWRLLLAPLRR